MDDEGLETEFNQVLTLLQEGLRKAEATMVSILGSIVADGAACLSELEAALSDAEAALTGD